MNPILTHINLTTYLESRPYHRTTGHATISQLQTGAVPQFFLPRAGNPGDIVSLPAEQAHHVRDVLRKAPGEKIRLFDGLGFHYQAEFESFSKREIRVRLLEKQEASRPKTALRIGQAVLKGEKMDWVVQKATELGVESIHPFVTSRTIARPKDEKKVSRWQKIADEACKQCGRARRLRIEKPVSLEEILRREGTGWKIIFWEEGGDPLRDLLLRLREKSPQPQTVFCLIGPEGGFAKEEIERAERAGFHVGTLGPLTLRSETATIVVIGILQYELGQLE